MRSGTSPMSWHLLCESGYGGANLSNEEPPQLA
jgi:hypothetical protein